MKRIITPDEVGRFIRATLAKKRYGEVSYGLSELNRKNSTKVNISKSNSAFFSSPKLKSNNTAADRLLNSINSKPIVAEESWLQGSTMFETAVRYGVAGAATALIAPEAALTTFGYMSTTTLSMPLAESIMLEQYLVLAGRSIMLPIGAGIEVGYAAAAGLFSKFFKPTALNKVGLTSRLGKNDIIQYLKNVKTVDREQLIKDIEALGLNAEKGRRNQLFLKYKDKVGRVRIQIHPADNKTNFSHLHVLDGKGRSLTPDLRIMKPNSPLVHIEVSPTEEEVAWAIKRAEYNEASYDRVKPK